MGRSYDESQGAEMGRTFASLLIDDQDATTTADGSTLAKEKCYGLHSKTSAQERKISDSCSKELDVDRCQLEAFTPFSRSHLWRLMSSFYSRQGVDSWAQGVVPHFITSNSFIAKRYCQLLRAFFMDFENNNIDAAEPFYIIELGAGSGKFSFYFLKMLCEYEHIINFPLKNIRYIMTDFTTKNVDYWKSHAALQPYVQRNLVDFAVFDATKDTELYLCNASITIKPNEVKNTICVIANYLFDTLHHDLFQIDKGVLKQGLISVGSRNANEPDPLDPEIITRMQNNYRYEQIHKNFYGSDSHLNNVLKYYKKYFREKDAKNATILIPIGAIQALQRLCSITNGNLLVFSGDKGTTNPDHFVGLTDPHIAIHGSFSLMVNYHAIGLYAQSCGGFAFHSPQEEASIKVSLFVLPRASSPCTQRVSSGANHILTMPATDSNDITYLYRHSNFPNLAAAYEDLIVSFGPNDFFVMQKALKEDGKQSSIKSILALLKLSNWDPDVFYKFRDILLDRAPSSSSKLRIDLQRVIEQIWRNHYLLDKEKDLSFEIARLYYGMQDYDHALKYYQVSIDMMGGHHVTSHNIGLCYYNKHQLERALQYFGEAHKLNPSYQKASSWMQRVQREFPVAKKTTADDISFGMPTSPTAVLSTVPLTEQNIEPHLPDLGAHESDSIAFGCTG